MPGDLPAEQKGKPEYHGDCHETECFKTHSGEPTYRGLKTPEAIPQIFWDSFDPDAKIGT